MRPEIVVEIIGGDVYVHHDRLVSVLVTVYNYDKADGCIFEDDIRNSVYTEVVPPGEGVFPTDEPHKAWSTYLHERGVYDEDIDFGQGGYDEDE